MFNKIGKNLQERLLKLPIDALLQMQCGKHSLGHSRRFEIVCQCRAEAFRADRAFDVRSRPESETFFESGKQLPVRGLAKKTEFVNSCRRSR
jgi:hypothetical protein